MIHYRAETKLPQVVELLHDNSPVAFDFETAPDEAYREEPRAELDAHKSHIVGISFSTVEGDAFYVLLNHKKGNNAEQQENLWDFLKTGLFEKTQVIKVAHNLAFEAMFLYARGIMVQQPCYDTIAAAQLTQKSQWEFRTLQDSGLKNLATGLFGAEMPSFSTVTDGRHFDEMDPGDYETIRYACADSDYTLRLYHKFNGWFDRFLPRHRVIAEAIEAPTAVYCGIIKYNGIPVDRGIMYEKQAEAAAMLNMLRDEIDSTPILLRARLWAGS